MAAAAAFQAVEQRQSAGQPEGFANEDELDKGELGGESGVGYEEVVGFECENTPSSLEEKEIADGESEKDQVDCGGSGHDEKG